MEISQISSDFSSIEGWSRNPFLDVYEPVIILSQKKIKKIQLPEKKVVKIRK